MTPKEIAVLATKLENLHAMLLDGKEQNSKEHAMVMGKLDSIMDNFVSKIEFQPVKTIVYGFVWLILVWAIGALLKLVIV